MIRYMYGKPSRRSHQIKHGPNELTSRWIVIGVGVVGRVARMVGGFGVEVGRKVVGSKASR